MPALSVPPEHRCRVTPHVFAGKQVLNCCLQPRKERDLETAWSVHKGLLLRAVGLSSVAGNYLDTKCSCGQPENVPQDVQGLIPKTGEYVALHGKGNLQVGLG